MLTLPFIYSIVKHALVRWELCSRWTVSLPWVMKTKCGRNSLSKPQGRILKFFTCRQRCAVTQNCRGFSAKWRGHMAGQREKMNNESDYLRHLPNWRMSAETSENFVDMVDNFINFMCPSLLIPLQRTWNIRWSTTTDQRKNVWQQEYRNEHFTTAARLY